MKVITGVLAVAVLLAAAAVAVVTWCGAPRPALEDWTGRTVRVTEPVKLARKTADGLVSDGATLDPAKTYVVTADDGTVLDLAGGHVYKFQARLVAAPEPPAVSPPEPEADAAINELSAAIRRRPDDRSGYVNRGDAWAARRAFDKAVADYTEAIRLDPGKAAAWTNRGNVWSDKGEYARAVADYTEAIRLDPKNAVHYSNRAYTRLLTGDHTQALADCETALTLDPDLAQAFENRAIAFAGLKRYAEAVASYEALLLARPVSQPILTYLCRTRAACPKAAVRNGKKAVAFGKRLVELDAANGGHRDALAMAHAEAGDFDRAVAEQQKAVEMLKAGPGVDAAEFKAAEARLELYRAKKPYRDTE